jgi:hypothetical protein
LSRNETILLHFLKTERFSIVWAVCYSVVNGSSANTISLVLLEGAFFNWWSNFIRWVLSFCPCYGTVYYGRKFDKESNKALTFA